MNLIILLDVDLLDFTPFTFKIYRNIRNANDNNYIKEI